MTTEVEKVTDSFAYSNGDLETVSSGTWQQLNPVNSLLDVSGGVAVSIYVVRGQARHTGGTGWTAEQWAECVLGAIAGGAGRGGVILRASADEDTARDFYSIYYDDSDDSLKFVKFVNGSESAIGASESVSFANGDILKGYAETSGSDCLLSAFKNGSLVTTRTDTTSVIAGASTDRVGLLLSNDATADTFRGGILTTGSGTEALIGSASTSAAGTVSPGITVAL